jgi:hypothetical protein
VKTGVSFEKTSNFGIFANEDDYRTAIEAVEQVDKKLLEY